jgi:hypothetical protein
MRPAAALIAELARDRESAWDFSKLKALAKTARAALVAATLQQARDEFLPAHSVRAAARIIAQVIHGRGTDNIGRQAKIRQLLMQKLGYLDDLPDWSRIRQLID